MRRVGKKGTGEFARISWDDAIAEITNRFKTIIQQWGGEAILPYHYGGSNGLLADKFIDDFYFATLGCLTDGEDLVCSTVDCRRTGYVWSDAGCGI